MKKDRIVVFHYRIVRMIRRKECIREGGGEAK